MQQRIAINGGFYVSCDHAITITGIKGIWRWVNNAVTGYGYPLKTVKHGAFRLVDERDVVVVAAVQQAFPVPKGRIPFDLRMQMKQYAERVHATLHPSI